MLSYEIIFDILRQMVGEWFSNSYLDIQFLCLSLIIMVFAAHGPRVTLSCVFQGSFRSVDMVMNDICTFIYIKVYTGMCDYGELVVINPCFF